MNPARNQNFILRESAMFGWSRRLRLILLMVFCSSTTPVPGANMVLPQLATNLVCAYDFEHPVSTNSAREADLGFSGTDLELVNGGAAMRTNDGAYPGSSRSLQTRQVNPESTGNDDWKAGIYNADGVATLSAFNAVSGITVMGWVKPTGANPNLNSETPAPDDYYNAIGLFGVLSGTSDGHAVRALLEVISVSGTLRLVALGRRIDSGSSFTLAATNNWQTLLPGNTWTHLTATFDFDNGAMALYRNGSPIGAAYTSGGDPWGISGGAEPDLSSPSNPAGIKIGGSFPQNTLERNPFNGRFDDLMFFNRALTEGEVAAQYASVFSPPEITVDSNGGQVALSWPESAADFTLESSTNLIFGGWTSVDAITTTNAGMISVLLPAISKPLELFRLGKR